jgi:hypothetical protein
MSAAERGNVMGVENDQPDVEQRAEPWMAPADATEPAGDESADAELTEPWMASAAHESAVVETPDGLPTMADLRAVSVDLDEIDEVLARLDAQPDDDQDPAVTSAS